MNRFVLSLSGLPFGRSLKVGTRDIASDWRHWSWTERLVAVLTALFLLYATVLIGRASESRRGMQRVREARASIAIPLAANTDDKGINSSSSAKTPGGASCA